MFSRVFRVIIILFSIYSCKIGAGIFPDAERYVLSSKEEHVIEAIKSFKLQNPEFKVPTRTKLKDGRRPIGGQKHWYIFYFYIPERNEILYTWVRETSKKNKTIFALVSVNKGLEIGNWEKVNVDLSRSENRIIKQIFKERIVNEVSKQLKKWR